jgi:hypothetical protein
MLATTGSGCFIKPFSTSRQDVIFCWSVPPLKAKKRCIIKTLVTVAWVLVRIIGKTIKLFYVLNTIIIKQH